MNGDVEDMKDYQESDKFLDEVGKKDTPNERTQDFLDKLKGEDKKK